MTLISACQKEGGKLVNLEVDSPGVWKPSGDAQFYLHIDKDSNFEQYRWVNEGGATYFNVQKGRVFLKSEEDSLVYSTKYSSCYQGEKQPRVIQRFKRTTAVALEVETPAGGSHVLERVGKEMLDRVKKDIVSGLWIEKCFTESSFDSKLILEEVGFKAKADAQLRLELEKQREAIEKNQKEDLSKRRNIPTGLPKGTIDPDRPLQA